MAEFYFNERTGKVHMRMGAGGRGGGMTSVIDVPATEAHFREYSLDYGEYLAKKRAAEREAAAATEKTARAAAGAEKPAEQKPPPAAIEVPQSASEQQSQPVSVEKPAELLESADPPTVEPKAEPSAA